LAEFLRGLAIITRPLRRAPDTGEAAGANDAFSLVKWMADTAICARSGGSSAESQRRKRTQSFDANARAAFFVFSPGDRAA
jgi:hypothetical protein